MNMRLVSLFLLMFLIVAGQSYAQRVEEQDSIILAAMQDELQKNMENLNEDGYDRPFFIGYRVSDLSLKLASASYGSLVSSKSTQSRDWNTRVMVGDYEISDENFVDSFEGSNNDVYYENVPLGADYWGLRRVLWAGTNNVYKKAARLFKQKEKALSDFQIDYPLADFTRTPPNTYIDQEDYPQPSQESLEEMSKDLSGYVSGFDSVNMANVILTSINARKYYVNSEGTSIVKNGQMVIGLVSISRVNDENELSSATLDYFSVGSGDLPSMEQIKKDIDWQMDFLKNKSAIEEIEEDYNGPVLLKGQAVADFFRANLFKVENGLLPERNSFNNKNEESTQQFFEELNEELTEEDERKIGNRQMKVTMLNHLSEFDGMKLIGAYDIDADGVVPPVELVLVEDGIIQQKINGRIPAPLAEKSTGSNRFSISIGSVTNLIAPGVLKIEFTDKVSESELLAMFDKRIEDNGNEEGIVIEMPALHSMSRPRQFFMHHAQEGTNRQVKKASFSYAKKSNLKKIVAVSDEYYVYNFLYSGNQYGGATAGVPVSLIVPSAILLRDADVSKVNYKPQKIDMIVPKPKISQE